MDWETRQLRGINRQVQADPLLTAAYAGVAPGYPGLLPNQRHGTGGRGAGRCGGSGVGGRTERHVAGDGVGALRRVRRCWQRTGEATTPSRVFQALLDHGRLYGSLCRWTLMFAVSDDSCLDLALTQLYAGRESLPGLLTQDTMAVWDQPGATV